MCLAYKDVIYGHTLWLKRFYCGEFNQHPSWLNAGYFYLWRIKMYTWFFNIDSNVECFFFLTARQKINIFFVKNNILFLMESGIRMYTIRPISHIYLYIMYKAMYFQMLYLSFMSIPFNFNFNFGIFECLSSRFRKVNSNP